MANSAVLGAPTGARAGADFQLRTPRGVLLRVRTWLCRARLDRQIAGGVERTGDRAIALRESQLVGSGERGRLAHRLEQVLTANTRIQALGAAPIDHEAVEVAKPILTEVILNLRSTELVEPRGVVLGWQLLTDPCSPIYAPPGGLSGDPDRLWHESLALLFSLRPLATSAEPEPARP